MSEQLKFVGVRPADSAGPGCERRRRSAPGPPLWRKYRWTGL